jgi:hypothetical protein
MEHTGISSRNIGAVMNPDNFGTFYHAFIKRPHLVRKYIAQLKKQEGSGPKYPTPLWSFVFKYWCGE